MTPEIKLFEYVINERVSIREIGWIYESDSIQIDSSRTLLEYQRKHYESTHCKLLPNKHFHYN
jgi:hypothetical protein